MSCYRFQCKTCGAIKEIDKPSSEKYIPECKCSPEVPMVEFKSSKREPGWEW